MVKKGSKHHFIINQRNQPIELFCGERVIMLPPKGQCEVTESEQTSFQIKNLCRRRIINLRSFGIDSPMSPPGVDHNMETKKIKKKASSAKKRPSGKTSVRKQGKER